MRYGTALVLIAVGAILDYAVTYTPSWIDLQTAGAILVWVGIAGLVLSLLLEWMPLWAQRRRTLPPAAPPAPPRVEDPHDARTRPLRRR
jgi:uncharacterized membrane protein YedE/YeeE